VPAAALSDIEQSTAAVLLVLRLLQQSALFAVDAASLLLGCFSIALSDHMLAVSEEKLALARPAST
jgi:hypothetical protein